MTREEFIAFYVQRSADAAGGNRRGDFEIMPDGYRLRGYGDRYRQFAVPCACGSEMRTGWAMVSADDERAPENVT